MCGISLHINSDPVPISRNSRLRYNSCRRGYDVCITYFQHRIAVCIHDHLPCAGSFNFHQSFCHWVYIFILFLIFSTWWIFIFMSRNINHILTNIFLMSSTHVCTVYSHVHICKVPVETHLFLLRFFFIHCRYSKLWNNAYGRLYKMMWWAIL